MDPLITKILENNRSSAVYFSHVGLFEPTGRYLFSRNTLENFWNVYCRLVAEKDGVKSGLAEKPQHYIPVLVDIDLKVNHEEGMSLDDKIYSIDHVIKIIEIYQSVLRKIVQDCDDRNLICVLLEKDPYTKVSGELSFIKNGFHLHFPNLFLSRVDQKVHLIPRIQEEVDNCDLFSDIPHLNDKVVDDGYCDNSWLLYGSVKEKDMQPYKVTRVFDSDCSEISIEQAFRDYDIYDSDENKIDFSDNGIDYYMPRILSIIPSNREIQELKDNLVSPMMQKINQTKLKREKEYMSQDIQQNLEVASKLIPMIDPPVSGSGHRIKWLTIGWALFNIGEGQSEALELWLEYSMGWGESYDESECIFEWDKMTFKDLTIGTLHHYASIDNPEKYKQFKKNRTKNMVKDSLNGSHNSIAKVLYSEYGNEFVCASIATKSWYQFREHRWEEIEEGTFLREKISSDILAKYEDMRKEISNTLVNIEDKAEEAMYQARLKQVKKIIDGLGSSTNKNNIMREAMEVFYDRRFKQKLDQDPHIIAFNNGVYDLKLHVLRPGRPEDFISKKLKIDYIQYSMEDDIIIELMGVLEKIFPDKEIKFYFYDTYCDVFVGGNLKKKIYMWTGDGDNGKSITQMLFDIILGELAVEMQTQYFTGKKISSGSANPELCRASPPVRLVTLAEPDPDEQLNIGQLKKLSGGDKFWARDLFERGKATREVTPMFMITFIVNKLIELKSPDKAIWNRIRVIPFESTFVDSTEYYPEKLEDQIAQKLFPKDTELIERLQYLAPAFAWFLLEWRKNMKFRPEPSKVKQATALYKKQNDLYFQFIEERIIIDESSSLHTTLLYEDFKVWFKQGWPNTSVPVKNTVKTYFEKAWGNPRKAEWKGFRLRNLKDDIEDGTVIELDDNDFVDYKDRDCLPPM